MKKSNKTILVLSFCFPLLSDQISKLWALEQSHLPALGLLNFEFTQNRGVLLGFFSNLPDPLRTASLSTLGVLILTLYLAIQFFLSNSSFTLRLGIALFMGSITGNMIDRIHYGSIIDFIVLGNNGYYTPAFNLADLFQWVSCGVIIGGLILDKERGPC